MSGVVETPIVVFDSVCVLCCAGLRWISRHDRRSHWRFLAMQSPRGAAALTAAGKALRDAAYRLVARNRYRWFGRRQSCFIPTAEESDRYLAG